ncbi:MTMR8 protein, partial [Polypterus senegalus]
MLTKSALLSDQSAEDYGKRRIRMHRHVNFEDLYAFLYNPKEGEASRKIGWTTVDVNADFQRMGLPNDYWEITDINATYGAAICRCSQPLSGFNARCVEDEQMLQAISDTNKSSPSMYVVDTPKLNAIANRAAGKGYENEDHYCNIKFQFVGIENIHIMRNSLQKLLEVCEMKSPSMSDYLTGLESSGWLRHIKAVMDAALFLVKAVAHEGASVLVHCSDGWDRTAQVCSLASLLLDPYYRTIKGLMVLIEKDWVSMGHKFTQRCGHLEGDPKEVSPVFTQFIECLWHLTEQFPCAFEFNEKLLLDIHDQPILPVWELHWQLPERARRPKPGQLSLVDISKDLFYAPTKGGRGKTMVSAGHQPGFPVMMTSCFETLVQEHSRKFINSREGWGIPGPLRWLP